MHPNAPQARAAGLRPGHQKKTNYYDGLQISPGIWLPPKGGHYDGLMNSPGIYRLNHYDGLKLCPAIYDGP